MNRLNNIIVFFIDLIIVVKETIMKLIPKKKHILS